MKQDEVELAAKLARVEDLPVVVRGLIDLLGGPSVAVIGNVRETRMVGAWLRGETPRFETEMRLRLAAQVAEILKSRFSDKTVRAWFVGANHWLGDEMPLALIAAENPSKAAKVVLSAARAALAT